MKTENEKDGERAQAVETGDAAQRGCAREDGFCGHDLVGLLWAIISLQGTTEVTVSRANINKAYERGREQIQSDLGSWERFLR